MKRATRRIVWLILLAMFFAQAAQARWQAPTAAPAVAAVGPWDWLENALTLTSTAAPLTVADSPILGLWRLKSVDGSPAPNAVVRQYASHPDGFLAMIEVTIDAHAVPRFKIYSAKPGASAAVYTDETFARFLLNGARTANTASLRLVDRNTLAVIENAGATAARRSALKLSSDGGTLTEVLESLDSAGNPSASETLVFGKQTAAANPIDPIRLPSAPAVKPVSNPPSDAPFNPLIGAWKLDEMKSPSKPEAGSVTLIRFIDLGKGAFGTLMARVSRAGAPTLEMAAVKFQGPDDLVLALPFYALPQIQVFLERDVLPASAVAYKMIDGRTVESTARSMSNGKVSAVTVRRFTEDLTQFTETRTAFDAQGKPAGDTVTVYTRVTP